MKYWVIDREFNEILSEADNMEDALAKGADIANLLVNASPSDDVVLIVGMEHTIKQVRVSSKGEEEPYIKFLKPKASNIRDKDKAEEDEAVLVEGKWTTEPKSKGGEDTEKSDKEETSRALVMLQPTKENSKRRN